jgi:hypothetical protein
MPEIFNDKLLVSFMFQVTCDDSKISESGGNEPFQHYSKALLCQVLKDPAHLERLMAQIVALEMENWPTGSIEEAIAGPVFEDGDVSALSVFGTPIENLPPIEKEWWKDVVNDTECSLSECTETIWDTFAVQLAGAQLQRVVPTNVVDAIPSTQNNDNYDDVEDEDFALPIRLDEELDDEGDEEALETQYVSIDALMGQGFTRFLAGYEEAKKARQDAAILGENNA